MLKSAENLKEFKNAADTFKTRAAELRLASNWYFKLWLKTKSPSYLEYHDQINTARAQNLRDWERCNVAGFNQ